jgi:very-short-patch-repair endonuclease
MKTTEQFIVEAKQIHGDRYDYSKVEYTNYKTKVVIICKMHGEFLQSIYLHINCKCGCKKCGDILRGQARKFTTAQFIEKAIEIHGETYDYSKSSYSGCYDKTIIICKNHGEFEQAPINHLRGSGCQKCYDDRRGESIRKTTTEFVDRAIKMHGDRYNYSKSNYISVDDNVTIICNTHGEFVQVAYSHINGQGCPTCGIEKRATNRTNNTEEFIRKSIEKHGDKYDYSKVKYKKNNIKVVIICKTHGEFLQIPANHYSSGYGCQLCVNKTEAKLYEKLLPIYPNLLMQFKEEWCKIKKHLPFDFCIQEHKIIIELDGRQHFKQVSNWSSPEEQFENDKFKEECANNNGYSVIRLLQEDVFYDTYDWVKELCYSIEELKNGDEIANIYLCKNNEYAKY